MNKTSISLLFFIGWTFIFPVRVAVFGRTELRGHVPPVVSRLTSQSRLPATNLLRLAISLPLRDPAGLDDLVRQIYDPASTNFHKFFGPEELAARFGPTPEDYIAVRNYAESNGLVVSATYPNRMVLDVEGQAA